MSLIRSGREVMEGWSAGISGTLVHSDRMIHVEHVWGTAISMNIAGTSGREARARSALDECSKFFAKVDEIFSTYRPESEVTLYRNGLSRPGLQSPEFEQVMQACTDLRRATGGSFDPWAVPGGFDPSGYVKGWAIGRASLRLSALGFDNHLINAGGDVCAVGSEYPGTQSGWPVGIVNPHSPEDIIKVAHLRDCSMATSGRYERGDHVIDPATGEPAVSVDSATVVGPDPGIADALASAAMVDGPAAMGWCAELGPQWSLYLVIGDTGHSHGVAFES